MVKCIWKIYILPLKYEASKYQNRILQKSDSYVSLQMYFFLEFVY
jgi:hypothetical protein